MAIFNWFDMKRRPLNLKRVKMPKKENKFVHVSFVAYYDGNLEKEVIEEMAQNMAMIITNTKAVFNYDGEFKGCVNPYLNINTFQANRNEYAYKTSDLTREFTPLSHKEDGKWKIIITPLKDNGEQDLYSLPNLFWDMFILVQANKWILERYNIKVSLKDGYPSSISTKLLNGYPIMDIREPLLKFEFEVSDRMKEREKMPELDEWVFGTDFYGTIESMREQSQKLKLTDEQKEWWKKVEKLLKTEK